MIIILPVEVRCYMSSFRCLARNARCDTMLHLTPDAVFLRTRLERNARCNTMSHLTAAGCRGLRSPAVEKIGRAIHAMAQGEQLVSHYLSNPRVLQKWRRM